MIQRESNMTGLVSMASPTVKTSIQANTASISARGPTPTPQVMQAASATSSTCSSVERGEAEAAST